MYIIETINSEEANFDTWAQVPNTVKITSLRLLSPDKKHSIKIEGYETYICMKEALMISEGFNVVANICYAINKNYSIKHRITNDDCTSTYIADSLILANSLNKDAIRSGVKSDFVI